MRTNKKFGIETLERRELFSVAPWLEAYDVPADSFSYGHFELEHQDGTTAVVATSQVGMALNRRKS